ncbi:MAG: type II toxin-antitoxin system VapC family toxin [Promicromonosporaceae bacterium]|nr:type II toxin-antitoxin system VapC family toxin [Promicromonosporaceae bacterium]
MRIIADTNLLVRIVANDDPRQSAAARQAVIDAQVVVVPTVALCEACWVLSARYRLNKAELRQVITQIFQVCNTLLDDGAVTAGLAVLDAGGDFADGVIAQTGTAAGGNTFVTFDKKAAKLVAKTGIATQLLK